MNSNSTIHISQAVGQLFNKDGSLSHSQQLESEERCKQRVNSLKGKAQRVKTAGMTADEQIQWAYNAVTKKLTRSFRDVIGYLALMESQFEEVTVAYGTVGDNIKRDEKTVDRGMKRARELRIAFSTPRFVLRNGKMVQTSNRTWLHPIFRHPKLREMLKGVSTFFEHVFKQTPRFLSLWLLFSASQPSLQVENVPGEYLDIYRSSYNVESDTTSREEILTHSRELNITSPKVSNIQSREMDITLNEDSHLLPARKSDMTSRELTREDTHSRDETPSLQEVPMEPKQIVCSSEVEEIFELSEQLKATDAEKSFAKPIEPKSLQDLSRQIDEARKSLEPQRAAQRALKAKVASELSEVLKGRVTATLHLSAKGQIYLMRFSDGALVYGLNNLAHHGTIDNRLNFRLFEAACFEYSRLNEIEVYVDRYDNTLKELGYTEAQPLCKKILLERPLAQKAVPQPDPQKAVATATYQPRRRIVKPPENSGQVAVDHFLQDSFNALALKLGYPEMVSNLPQISTESVDNV